MKEKFYSIYHGTHTSKTRCLIHFFQKLKKFPDGFCTRLYFDSSIILLFCGSFLHRLYRLLKLKLKWLRVKTTEFVRQKIITKRENPHSNKPSWKKRKNTPKATPKIDLLFSARIQRIGYVTDSFQECNTETSWI